MKKTILILLVSGLMVNGYAQTEPNNGDEKEVKKHKFKKEKLFIGGDLTASFYSGGTVLGVSPYFGYSINKFIDVAANLNFNYTSERDYYDYGDKVRQVIAGPGAFIRVYPVHFLFAQAQYEHNFIRQRYIPGQNNVYAPSIIHFDANSVLVGGGYTMGRRDGSNTFYYFSVLWDITRVAESPYVDGQGRSVPIIKAGMNFALFQGNNHKRKGRW
jgi:hypothetical protein